MNKKIVMYSGYYYPNIGGVQKVVSELVSRLKQHGFEITVVTCNTENAAAMETVDGINIIRLPCWQLLNNSFTVPKPTIAFIHFFFNQLKSDFDVIVTHTRFYPLCFLGFIIAKIKRRPLLHVDCMIVEILKTPTDIL